MFHCRNDTLIVTQSMFDQIDPNSALINHLVCIVPHIELKLFSTTSQTAVQQTSQTSTSSNHSQRLFNQSDNTNNQSVTQEGNQAGDPQPNAQRISPFLLIARAVVCDKLKSLRLNVIRDIRKEGPNYLQELVACISKVQTITALKNQPIELAELFISIQSHVKERYHSYEKHLLPPVDLTCLVGHRMHTINLDLSHFDYSKLGIRYFLRFFRGLPSTLTFLKIDVYAWELYEDDHLEVQALLGDSSWLPHIQVIDVGKPFFTCRELSTVMHATGTQRPFQSLKLLWNDQSLKLHPFIISKS